MQKKLGILGGMGPMATVDFMRRIVVKSPATCDQEHIPMIISNNPTTPDRTTCILHQGSDPIDVLLKDLDNLKQAGATKVVIPCNTAHHWLEKLSNRGVEFISIIDSVLNAAQEKKMQRIGIMATDATIKINLYRQGILDRGLEPLQPDEQGQAQVMEGILAVKAGNIAKGRELMAPIFDQLIADGADGVILGCTEIPLAFDDFSEQKKQRALDSLDLLAEQCVNYYYYQA